MSKFSPRYFILIAEHSMCHPGLPFPQGLSHVGFMSEYFHNAKSSASFFVSIFNFLGSSSVLPSILFIEFLFGILIGTIYFSNNNKLKYIMSKFSYTILLTGIISLFLSLFISLNYNRIVLYGIPSFFIVLAAVFLKQNSNKILIFLGNASYSIYLTHFLILGITNGFFTGLSITNGKFISLLL